MINIISEFGYYFSSGGFLIDLVFAGENAFAIVLAASTLSGAQKVGAIAFGVMFSFVLRIVMWSFVEELTRISGFILIAGIVAFWMAWRSWSDLKAHQPVQVGYAEEQLAPFVAKPSGPTTIFAAIVFIVIADIGFTGENVVALSAGGMASQSIFGSLMSTLMKLAAAPIILRLITRFRWISIVGVIAIIYAGMVMIWEDGHSFLPGIVPAVPTWLGGHA